MRSQLTPRESEILAILAEGVVRIKDVADRLGLSPNTVNNHVNSIFMKTRTRSKSQLLAGLLNHVAEELQRARYFKQSPQTLILERDQAFANTIRQILIPRGFKVQVFSNQYELERWLDENPAHFIVADVGSLAGDTPSFINMAQKNSCAQVLLIGGGAAISRSQAMNEGAIDLLAKPLDVVQLLEVLMAHYIEEDSDRARFLETEVEAAKIGRDDVLLTPENTGVGGLFLSADELRRVIGTPVTIGDLVELKLCLERENDPIPARGQVVWSRSESDSFGCAGVGVRFTKLTNQGRERLGAFLKQNQIRSYIPAGEVSLSIFRSS